jgi:hypothetical protein
MAYYLQVAASIDKLKQTSLSVVPDQSRKARLESWDSIGSSSSVGERYANEGVNI